MSAVFGAGDRVRWEGPQSKEPYPAGTVIDAAPDADGRIAVNWDRIGTFREDPDNLGSLPD